MYFSDMEWPKPTVFDAKNTSPWAVRTPQEIPKPVFADDEELKMAYGVALGKGLDAFNAAMEVFNQVLPNALWASLNWIKDPIVIGSRDGYLRSIKKAEKPLDKAELLAEILQTARQSEEDKDRIAALKLYSEILGFTGPKIAIDASSNINNTQNNTTQIVLVKGSEERTSIKTIEAPDNNSQSKIHNSGLPNLKLVGGSR